MAGVIVRDGLILAAKRHAGGPTGLQWEFPGGKVEPGEAPQDALKRELIEELGAVVIVGDGIGVFASELGAKRLLLDCYWCSVAEGEPQAHDHAALKWCSPDELVALDWAAPDVPVMRAVLAQLVNPRS